MNTSFGIYLLMRRGGRRYRPYSLRKEAMEVSGAKEPAFFQLISYDKDLKHIKTGNYSIKYGVKIRTTTKR